VLDVVLAEKRKRARVGLQTLNITEKCCWPEVGEGRKKKEGKQQETLMLDERGSPGGRGGLQHLVRRFPQKSIPGKRKDSTSLKKRKNRES